MTKSDKIDQIVLNRWLGIPIFLGVMYLLFMFTINVGGAFIDFFDILFGTIFVDGLGRLLSAIWYAGFDHRGAGGRYGWRYSNRGHLYPGDCLPVPVYGLSGRQRLHGSGGFRDGPLYAVRGAAREIFCAHAGGLRL